MALAILDQIHEIKRELGVYFPGEPIKLEMFRDPESDDKKLVLYVETSRFVYDAMRRLDWFDKEYLLGIDCPCVNVTLRFVK